MDNKRKTWKDYDIYDKATTKARDIPSQVWKRAYLNLADAADRIDAMLVRTKFGDKD